MTALFDLGDRVDDMIKAGKSIVQGVIDEHRPVAIFACWSSGNDSVVTTHFACSNFNALAINVDTMIGTQRSRDHAVNVAEKFRWPFERKRATARGCPKKHRDGSPFDVSKLPLGRWIDGDTAYEEFALNYGLPGPGMHPRMYQRLKERVFREFKRDAKRGNKATSKVVYITGIRRDESSIRAGYNRAVQVLGSDIWINPFYYFTAADFHAYREEFGLPRNPVSQVIGISGECLCGTMAKPGERDLIGSVDPDAEAKIATLESHCRDHGLPCHWGERPEKNSHDPLQRLLFELDGQEPSFMPACVGCLRRQTADRRVA